MQYSHSIQKATSFAQKAMKRLQEEKLAPTPEAYEVWYVYYAGIYPDIIKAVDALIKSEKSITNEHCQVLHDRFLGERAEGDKIRKAGDEIQKTIHEVSDAVGSVKSATTNYGDNLSKVTQVLKKGKLEQGKLEGVLNSIISNTDEMMAQNQQLEKKLAQSSKIMEDLQHDLEQVRKEAVTDSLTNLSNRKAFDSEIVRISEEAKSEDKIFSLIMMDIDHFKSFNDNFGHQVGDQVLRLVARTLVDGVKGRDLAARYGGEEFAIILPETNMKGAFHVADNLRLAVANKDVINRNSGEKIGRITLSAGVSEYIHGERIEQLIERADSALYTAKHNGRNQVATAPSPKKS